MTTLSNDAIFVEGIGEVQGLTFVKQKTTGLYQQVWLHLADGGLRKLTIPARLSGKVQALHALCERR